MDKTNKAVKRVKRPQRRVREKTQAEVKRNLLVALAVFLCLCAFAAAMVTANLPQNKKQVINGITLRGEITGELVMGNATYYYIVSDEIFTFDIQIKYSDQHGAVTYSPPTDVSDITMLFSDTSLCDRIAYNQIMLHSDVPAGTTFTVKTIYNKEEVTYTFFVGINTEATINENGYITNPDNYTALCGGGRRVDPAYVPNDLVSVTVKCVDDITENNKLLRSDAAGAAIRMFTAAKNDGYILIAERCYDNSSYHGYEHKLGLAIDITCVSAYYNSKAFSSTGEYRWLTLNAYKYGFVERYEPEKVTVTGMSAEPRHWRYVGAELAEYLYRNALALEEVTIEALEGF